MTFSSFFGRKCCKTQDIHDPLPQPRFPCGRASNGATRSCRQHPRKSSPDTPVKNNKNTRFVISFQFAFLFHFISFQFFSLRYSLIHSFIPSFTHSFIHSFIQSYMSWVCLPGFFERWAAEFRQGCPATALWPARCLHVFFTLYFCVLKVYFCLLNVKHFFVLRNLERILLHFGIIPLFFGSSSKVSFCPLKV